MNNPHRLHLLPIPPTPRPGSCPILVLHATPWSPHPIATAAHYLVWPHHIPEHTPPRCAPRQGTPGSRLFVHPDVRAAGHVPGWRLVVLERPGVGLSDPPPPGYSYRDFAADFRYSRQL